MALAMTLAHYPDVKVDEVAESAPFDANDDPVSIPPLFPTIQHAAVRLAEYCTLEEHVD